MPTNSYLDYHGLQTFKTELDTAYNAKLAAKINTSARGAANGVAPLNANSKIPTTYLPDQTGNEVLEYAHYSSFPAEGIRSVIYVDRETNKIYRWSGSRYIELSPSDGTGLQLGDTSDTAFRGDWGTVAYAHAFVNRGSAFSSGLYKITTNSEGHVTEATAVQKSDITALGIPGEVGASQSLPAANNGTTLSLVTTGEKYAWNNKSNIVSIRMNGSAKPITNGIVDLGTVLTQHQDLSDKIDRSEMGTSNGVATLGPDGKVPAIQLPAGQTVISKIMMNNQEASMDSEGVVNLGTVITQHQDLSGKVDTYMIGAVNGVAPLGSDGKVPSQHLPPGNAIMQGATGSNDGEAGMAPAPVAGDNTKFLRGDGTWQDVPVADKAQILELATADEEEIFSALDGMDIRKTYVLRCSGESAYRISGGLRSNDLSGTIYRYGTGDFRALVTEAPNTIIAFSLTGVTEDSFGTYTEEDVNDLLSKSAFYVKMGPDDTDWQDIWDKLETIPVGNSAVFYAHSAAVSLLTDGLHASGFIGSVARITANQYSFISKYASYDLIDVGTLTKIDGQDEGVYTEKNMAGRITLGDSDTNWAAVWAKIGALRTNETALIFASGNGWTAMTGSNSAVANFSGVITRTSSTQFYLSGRTSSNRLVSCAISSAADNSAGTYTEQIIKGIGKASYTQSFSYEAGSSSDIGTRAAYKEISLSTIVSGWSSSSNRVLGVYLSAWSTNAYNVQLRCTTTALTIFLYRASTAAVTNSSVTVNLVYD